MWKPLERFLLKLLNQNNTLQIREPTPLEIRATREAKVKEIVEHLLPDEPYVHQGKFSWFLLSEEDSAREISFFFLDLPLCIQVHPLGVVPILKEDEFIITSGSNEQSAAEFLRKICKSDGYGLLEIYPDADITEQQIERNLIRMGIL